MAEVCHLELVLDVEKITGNQVTNMSRSERTFNRYVNPGGDTPRDLAMTAIHGLYKHHPLILGTNYIDIVWKEFQQWVNKQIRDNEATILVACNGISCNLKWIWRLTQVPLTRFNMPRKVKFFLDPRNVVGKYKSCDLDLGKNKSKSGW